MTGEEVVTVRVSVATVSEPHPERDTAVSR
jgi:hypothetical protein